jgi:hypothetical protein
MALVAEIVRFLQSAGLSLTEGTNLFRYEFPEVPTICVTVEHPPVDDGMIRTFGPDGTAPVATQPRFIVVVRDTDRQTAMSLARKIRLALDDKSGALTNPEVDAADGSSATTLYHAIRALTEPYERPAYKDRTFEIAVTYSAMKERS